MAQLKLYWLGPARIEQNGKVVEVETRKAVALLAYLALHPERLSRDHLAALLWPEYDQERAYANLRRTLWALNKALGEGWLTADNLTLALPQQAGVWVDALEFQRLLAQSRDHGHRSDEVCAACLEPLGQAVQLVRGDFLEGFSLRDSAAFDDWHFFEAESLRKALAATLEKLVRGHSSQQEDETAINYARRWLALDPLHELAHRWLMQLYAWTGQPSVAVRQYQECVRVLKAELGAPPDQETTALSEQIRTGKLRKRTDTMTRWHDDKLMVAPAHPVIVSSPQLDFGQPVAVQARAVTLAPPLEFPAETVGRTAFVARVRELATLDEFLKRALADQGGVVFVTGEAGSGKTALLRAFAARASVQTDNLLVASGYCNMQSGLGDPYLPFRQILRLLTGDLGARGAQGVARPCRTLVGGHAARRGRVGGDGAGFDRPVRAGGGFAQPHRCDWRLARRGVAAPGASSRAPGARRRQPRPGAAQSVGTIYQCPAHAGAPATAPARGG
jgi:DNA-binding SARP family transcriptional activator